MTFEGLSEGVRETRFVDGGPTSPENCEAVGSRLDQLDRMTRVDEPDGGGETDIAGADDGDASPGGFHLNSVTSRPSGRAGRGRGEALRKGWNGIPC